MWFSHGNHVVSTFESMCCPPGNHMLCTWKPHGICCGAINNNMSCVFGNAFGWHGLLAYVYSGVLV